MSPREVWESVRDTGEWREIGDAGYEFVAHVNWKTYTTTCRSYVEQHHALCSLGHLILSQTDAMTE